MRHRSRKQRRLANEEKERQKDREFLLEIPDLYNLKSNARTRSKDATSGSSRRPPKRLSAETSDAKNLLKIKGTLWIDKSEYQWVRVEAETIDTLTWGFFLGRINPGAKLLFEQTRVNDEIWLPKRQMVSGSGRIVGKRIAGEEEVTWSNFRKFRVESNIVVE